MTHRIELNFALGAALNYGTWVDVTDGLLDVGFKRKQCFGADGKAEQQTLAFTLKPVVGGLNVATAILACAHDIRARVTLVDAQGNTTAYFIGTVRPLLTSRAKSVLEPISLQIIDDSYLLDYKLTSTDEEGTTYPHPSMQLLAADPTPDNSLIYWLLCHVKTPWATDPNTGRWAYYNLYTASNIASKVVVDASVGSIGATLAQGMELRVGDNVKSKLDAVMYEMGLQYRFLPDGRMYITSSAYESADYEAGATLVTDDDMRKALAIKKSEAQGLGAIVSWYPISTATKPLEMFRSASKSGTLSAGASVQMLNSAGGTVFEFSSTGDDLAHPDLNSISGAFEGSSLYTGNAVILHKPSLVADITCVSTSAELARGVYKYTVMLRNDDSRPIKYDGCVVANCNCTYVDKKAEKTERSGIARVPIKHSCTCIHTEGLAQRLRDILTYRSQAGSVSYNFELLRDGSLAATLPGDVLHIVSATAGVDTYARVVAVTDAAGSVNSNTITVDAEGIEPLEDLPSGTSESVINYHAREGVVYLAVEPGAAELNEGDLASVNVIASGQYVDNYGCAVAWELNGAAVSGTGKVLEIPTANLVAGTNTVTATATYNGTTLSRSCTIQYNCKTNKGGNRYDSNGDVVDWSADGYWFGADGTAKMALHSDNAGNTFLGTDVGKQTQTDPEAEATGNYNTGIGYRALYGNTTGDHNVALGYLALRDNTTGNYNTAIGALALAQCTSGSGNIAIGPSALTNLLQGIGNVGIGQGAGSGITFGQYNVAIGNGAEVYNPLGYHQVALGGLRYLPFNAGRATYKVARALYSCVEDGKHAACLAAYGASTIVHIYRLGKSLYLSDASGTIPLQISEDDAYNKVLAYDLKMLVIAAETLFGDALNGA